MWSIQAYLSAFCVLRYYVTSLLFLTTLYITSSMACVIESTTFFLVCAHLVQPNVRNLKKIDVYIDSDLLDSTEEMTSNSILWWLFRFHKIVGWECIYKKRNVSRAKMTFDDPKKDLEILAKVLFYILLLCRISLFISNSSRQVFPTRIYFWCIWKVYHL